MLTLAIDTSTNILSVALVDADKVLAGVNEQTKNNQSEILMSRIERMMVECSLRPTDLERIAVAIGPGSYTGIRVGVAAAKSLAYALGIPVVSLSSLEVMAMAAVPYDLRIPMIDARRGAVFAGVYDYDGTNIVADRHVTLEQLIDKLIPNLFKNDMISFIGDGALIHKEILLKKWPDAQVVSESEFMRCKAEILAELTTKALRVENVHGLNPSYLRKTEAQINAGV